MPLCRSILGIIPGVTLLTSLACLSGLVVFAYYASIGCDPLSDGTLSNPNQVTFAWGICCHNRNLNKFFNTETGQAAVSDSLELILNPQI